MYYISLPKTAWYSLLLLCLPVRLLAQPAVTDPRSQRDADVLRTVLSAYFKEANPDKQRFRVSTQRADVKYFTGFGLLIAAPAYVPSGSWSTVGGGFSFATPGSEDDEDDDEAQKPRPTPPTMPDNEQVMAVMKQFAGNYGSLMNFLQPNEKVIFYYDKKPDRLYKAGFGGDAATGKTDKSVKSERIVLELTAADLRLSAADLTAKAKPTVVPLEKTTRPEFEIMGKIYYSTFEPAAGSQFTASQDGFTYVNGLETSPSRVRYEYFKGLGVIYSFAANYTGSRRLRTVRGDVLMNHSDHMDMDMDMNIDIDTDAMRHNLGRQEIKRIEKDMRRTEEDMKRTEEDMKRVEEDMKRAEEDMERAGEMAREKRRQKRVRSYDGDAQDGPYPAGSPAPAGSNILITPPTPPEPPAPPHPLESDENIVIEESIVHKNRDGEKARQKNKNKAGKEKPVSVAPATPEARAAAANDAAQAAVRATDDYASFVKAVKNYVVDYGRTLRTLAPDERVVVSIALNAGQASSLPGRVELSVSKSVLEDYDKRRITLEEAAAKITVREYAKTSQARQSVPRIQFFQLDE